MEEVPDDMYYCEGGEREDGFREGNIRILVASDVAARGLDVPSVSQSTLYNLSLPDAFFWHYYSALAEFKGARLFILLTESQLFWVFYFVQKEIFLVLVW